MAQVQPSSQDPGIPASTTNTAKQTETASNTVTSALDSMNEALFLFSSHTKKVEESLVQLNKTMDMTKTLTSVQTVMTKYQDIFQKIPDNMKVLRQHTNLLNTSIDELVEKNIISLSASQLQLLKDEIKNFAYSGIGTYAELIKEFPNIAKFLTQGTQLFANVTTSLPPLDKVQLVNKAFKDLKSHIESFPDSSLVTMTTKKMLTKMISMQGQIQEFFTSPLAGFKQTVELVKSIASSGSGWATIIIFAMKALGNTFTTISNNISNLGSVMNAVTHPIGFMHGVLWKVGRQAGFLGRDIEDLFKVTNDAFKIGLFRFNTFAQGITTNFVADMGIAANYVDMYAKQIGSSFQEIGPQMVQIMNLVHGKILGTGEALGRNLITWHIAINTRLKNLFATDFNEFQNIFKNVFSKVLFLGKDGGTQLLNLTIGFSSQLINIFTKQVPAGFRVSKEHITTILSELNNAIGKSGWDMYYGILSMTGKLSGDLNSTLKQAFSADPMTRFITTAQYFQQLLGKEMPDVFAAWIPGLEGLREYPGLVEKVSKALTTLFESGKQLDLTKASNVESLLAGAGLSQDELVMVRQSMENFGDPLKTLVKIGQKILNILSTIVGRGVLGAAGYAGKSFGYKSPR